MTIKENISNLLPRKILSATIAGSLYAVLYGLFAPSPFGEEINSIREYMGGFVVSTPMYLMYSFPVILVYGTLTSTLSDFLSSLISRNKISRMEMYISALFHLLFGSVLLWISLSAALIYFIIDRFLVEKKSIYKWSQAFKSLAIPFLLWVLFMGIVWLIDFYTNWTNYIVN